MKRKCFTFYDDILFFLQGLTQHSQLVLLNAIIRYGLNKEEPTDLTPQEQYIWGVIRKPYDIGWVRSEVGRLGGAPKGNTNAQKQPKNNQNNDLLVLKTTKKQPKNNQKTTKIPIIKEVNNIYYNNHDNNNLNLEDNRDKEEIKKEEKEKKEDNLTVIKEKRENEEEKKESQAKESCLSEKEKKRLRLKAANEAFKSELMAFIPLYGEDMIRDFYDYWTEPTISGVNNRKGQQSTWSTERRLRTWSKNNYKSYGNNNNSHPTEQQQFSQRNWEAAQHIANMLNAGADATDAEEERRVKDILG